MIYFLKGILQELNPSWVLLDVHGVGYHIYTPFTAYETLNQQRNQKILLYVRIIYRDTDRLCYGFLSNAEAILFDFLRNLQGIGAQLSFNLIATLGKQNVLQALQSGNTENILTVPKIGKVKASKLMFEVQQKPDKLSSLLIESEVHSDNASHASPTLLRQIEDTLKGLGFQQKEITNAYQRIRTSSKEPPPIEYNTLSEWIKLFLQNL